MDKRPLIVGSLCAVVLLVLTSFGNVVGYQSVKSTVNDSPLFIISEQNIKIKPFAEHSERIFHEMKEKMKTACTQEECKIIFKETLIELEKIGLLGDKSAKDVYKILCDSYENGDSFSVYGESNHTNFLKQLGVIFLELSNKFNPLLFHVFGIFFYIMYQLYEKINFHWWPGCIHLNSNIYLGYMLTIRSYIYGHYPAWGYLKIVGPDGQTEYNHTFYGNLSFLHEIFNPNDPEEGIIYCLGIKGFTGILINGHYFGTAKEVGIVTNAPDPWPW